VARATSQMPLTHRPPARLHARPEFTAVQQGGRRVATRYLTLLALPNMLGHDRLGIIASRRIGGAVTRNRAKRRIREIFRQRAEEARPVDGRRGLDLVVIARAELARAPFPAVAAEFLTALGRLRGPRPS
jgi:ribonuclease P protein component